MLLPKVSTEVSHSLICFGFPNNIPFLARTIRAATTATAITKQITIAAIAPPDKPSPFFLW